jgi:predicted ferric reductase
MRPAVLILLYLIVVLAPLALTWLLVHPPRLFWDELASGAGLLAFAIILVEFVLSGRFRSVSRRIGMDKTMRFHQLLARTALAFAILHPFLYVSPFGNQRPWDPTRQLTLTSEIGALGSGALAWIILPAFVLLSIARDKLSYRYETWRLMHGLGAILIVGLLLHHTLSAGRYSQDPILTGLWLVLVFGAIASLIFVYVLKPFSQLGRAWTVSSVRPLALKTWAISIAPKDHAGLDYQAGQFAWLNLGKSPFSLYENPFSISSAPASGKELEFIIKELGDSTRRIGQIKPGTKAYIDGPHGNLVVSDRAEPGIAFIAGGVGIVPLLGIMRQLRLEGDRRPTLLVYGNRIEEQIVYREELDAFSQEHGTKLVHALSEPAVGWNGYSGLVDAALIKDVFSPREMKRWLFIMCGPPVMMDVVEQTLIELGVPAHQILSERFKYD